MRLQLNFESCCLWSVEERKRGAHCGTEIFSFALDPEGVGVRLKAD
jgi:hypothetical protein